MSTALGTFSHFREFARKGGTISEYAEKYNVSKDKAEKLEKRRLFEIERVARIEKLEPVGSLEHFKSFLKRGHSPWEYAERYIISHDDVNKLQKRRFEEIKNASLKQLREGVRNLKKINSKILKDAAPSFNNNVLKDVFPFVGGPTDMEDDWLPLPDFETSEMRLQENESRV